VRGVRDQLEVRASGVFDQFDVIAALLTGNYLQGPYAATVPMGVAAPIAVPEPSALVLALIALAAFAYLRWW
jgi:hypothetical protein